MISESKKVILTGNFAVGKTSLFNKFIHDKFDEKYLTTIGVKVNKKQINVDGKDVSLLLWDIAGEVMQNKIPDSYFLGASAVIYVLDLTRGETYKNILEDLDHLRKMVPLAVLKVVGNKVDLQTPEETAQSLANIQHHVDITTSAKTGENVIKLFEDLAREVI